MARELLLVNDISNPRQVVTMNRMILRKFRSRQGFTFIEIMLVVLIIGILMAAVVPNLVGRTRGARVSVAKASLRTIEQSLGTFEMKAGRFPTTEEGLESLRKRPGDLTEDEWDGPYIKDEILDPWKEPFVYKSPGDNNRDYDLFSKGPDKREGTNDDVYPGSGKRDSSTN
jgi:general secretion pathway protein G